ncbi:MAG: regulator of protease activity HflC (stomatin/prohibitin superfamily), partial [Marinoscillum sp.]
MNIYKFLSILLASTILMSCSVVRQGEIGMKRRIGKLDQNIILPGAVGYNPFI